VVIVSVCLSSRISQKSQVRLSPNSLCMLPVAVAVLQYVMYFRFCGWRRVFPMVTWCHRSSLTAASCKVNTPAAWYRGGVCDMLLPCLRDASIFLQCLCIVYVCMYDIVYVSVSVCLSVCLFVCLSVCVSRLWIAHGCEVCHRIYSLDVRAIRAGRGDFTPGAISLYGNYGVIF